MMNTFALLNRMNTLVPNLFDSDVNWQPQPELDSLNRFVENKGSYEIKLNLAGASKKSIEVSFQDKILTVLGEADEGVNYHYRCSVPSDNVDVKKIKAKYEDGILSLSVPKKEEAKPIAIKVN